MLGDYVQTARRLISDVDALDNIPVKNDDIGNPADG
jgi:hypothetical protein